MELSSNPQPLPPTETPKTQWSYSKRLILGSLVIILIAVAVVFIPRNDKQNSTPSISTGDWKTYTNDQYGFEIKYPNDYEVLESEDQGAKVIAIYPAVVKDSAGLQIIILTDTVNNHASKIIANANAIFPDNDMKVYEGRLEDQTVVKTINYRTSSNSPYKEHTLIQKGDKVYQFAYLDSSSDSTGYRIFRSLKFTK